MTDSIENTPEKPGFLAKLKEFITGKGVTKTLGAVEWAAEIGKYMGLDPKVANTAYAVETIQKAFADKLKAEETVGHLTGAVANWLVTDKLKERGMPAPLAAALGDTASKLLDMLVQKYSAPMLDKMRDTKVGDLLGMEGKNVSGGQSVAGQEAAAATPPQPAAEPSVKATAQQR